MAQGTASASQERAADAGSGPVLVRWTAPDALSNLVAVLELAADGQVRCSAATRRPSAATVKLIEDALVAGDFYDCGEPITAFAWPLLLQAGGLARLVGTRLELSPRGRATLERPSYEALAALWARWVGSVSQDELARVEAIKGQRKPGTLTSAVTRRAAVAAALAALEPGTWTGVGKLLGIVRAQRPPLVATRSLRALWRLYVIDSYYGSLGYAGPSAWDLVEGRYALCVLFEYAATVGLSTWPTPTRAAHATITAPCGVPTSSAACPATTAWPRSGSTSWAPPCCTTPTALPGLGLPVPRRT